MAQDNLAAAAQVHIGDLLLSLNGRHVTASVNEATEALRQQYDDRRELKFLRFSRVQDRHYHYKPLHRTTTLSNYHAHLTRTCVFWGTGQEEPRWDSQRVHRLQTRRVHRLANTLRLTLNLFESRIPTPNLLLFYHVSKCTPRPPQSVHLAYLNKSTR